MSRATERAIPASEQGRSHDQRGTGLQIGAPDDQFEREADRVADEIVSGRRQSDWSLSKVSFGQSVQRKCACGGSGDAGGECEECNEKKTLQRKAVGPAQAVVAPPIVHDVLKSPGQPLDRATRDYFEPRFGRDLGSVRVHADQPASRSAQAVGAAAYTVADNIVFNDGQYSPTSGPGRKLLAHELTHVVQRDRAPVLRRQPTQGGTEKGKIRPLVQKFIDGTATEDDKTQLRALLKANQITDEEFDALKQHVGNLIIEQVLGNIVHINIGGPLHDVHTSFKARLKIHVSGALKAVAGGLEGGTVEAVAEVNADAKTKKVIITITPPEGDTMAAEMIRAKAFPNGALTFELGESALKGLNWFSLVGPFSVVLTGKKGKASGPLTVNIADLPDDLEIEVSLLQSAERPTLAPATGAPARPPLRAFVTGGIATDPTGVGATTTLGFDAPFGNDTKNPLIYGAVGLRAGADTHGGLRVGGDFATGLNLNPVTLQMAFEAGIARIPAGQNPAGTGAKGSAYFGVEASAGVQVSKRVQVMALASLIGGSDRDSKASASLEAGVGFTF